MKRRQLFLRTFLEQKLPTMLVGAWHCHTSAKGKVFSGNLLSYVLLAMVGLGSLVKPVVAQPANCQPPKAGEYLLLVVSETADSQAQVKRTVPPSVNTTVCRYLDSTVTRVEGFTTLDVANSWARYMTEIVGLPAFVAQPPQANSSQPSASPSQPAASSVPAATSTASSPSSATPSPAQTSAQPTIAPIAYNPELLGQGYAVLVDYQQNPELAAQLKRLLGRDVGLVSYRQRPYLLANHTPHQGTANATLKAVSDRGFIGLIVDGNRVMMLSRVVRY